MRKNYRYNPRLESAFLRAFRSDAKTEQRVCLYCREPFPVADCTADHLHPVSRGGQTQRGNIAAACTACNSLKGSMSVNQFKKAIRHPEGRSFGFWLANQRFRLWRRTEQAVRRIRRAVGIEEKAA